jgi:hypothetical protein
VDQLMRRPVSKSRLPRHVRLLFLKTHCANARPVKEISAISLAKIDAEEMVRTPHLSRATLEVGGGGVNGLEFRTNPLDLCGKRAVDGWRR